MQKQKNNRFALAILIIVMLALSTCTPQATQPPPSLEETGSQGETLIIGLSSAIMTLDPADHSDRATETVLRNMFDGLVTRTPQGEVVLELAESFQQIDDTTWEFVLKQGVTFHNGEALTTEDVQFTFDRIMAENGIEFGISNPEPHTSPRQTFVGPMESIEVIDDYTIHFHFSEPWPVGMQMLVHTQIIPKDYYQEVGAAGFLEFPVGCGPFRFVEGSLNDQVVMERFDAYYGGANELPPVGPALLARLIFCVMPDAQARVVALQAGEVHIIQDVPPELVPTLLSTPYVQISSGPSTRPLWMEMNVNRPPFDDLRVRQAMNYAVDTSRIVEETLNGLGISLAGPLSPFNEFAAPNLSPSDSQLPPYSYDPEQALRLLADAGWIDSNGDGYLDQDGERLAFTIDVRSREESVAEAVAAQLRAIGINVQVEVVADYSLLQEQLFNGERDAFVNGWGDSAFDPVGHFEAKWHSRVAGTAYGRGNYSGYANRHVDQLIESGESEMDQSNRHVIYDQAQQMVYDDVPAVFLVLPYVVEASTIHVHNWKVSSDGRLNMHDVWLSPLTRENQ
ncbi:MAG: ABC transporter substrate-binding protein [Anaerolineae bacterium]|nr:ABC transporter substrate-binding protein [Anaerolineae bacterium]